MTSSWAIRCRGRPRARWRRMKSRWKNDPRATNPPVLGDPAEQGDAAFDRDQPGGAAAGGDLGGQVDQFGVFPPGPHGDHDPPAGAQERGGEGEDAGEPGQQPVVADVGQVPAVEQVPVEVVALVHPGGSVVTWPWVEGPYGGEVTTSATWPCSSAGRSQSRWRASPVYTVPSPRRSGSGVVRGWRGRSRPTGSRTRPRSRGGPGGGLRRGWCRSRTSGPAPARRAGCRW